jgi:hypothetical protein
MSFAFDEISEFSEKINIDELFEKKQQLDLKKLALYQKILNRIHVRIKTIARNYTQNNTYCWFVVPEFVLGVSKFDQGACIAYIVNTLKENKFRVKYYHPNTLFISWDHWVPSYVREEIKKKMGIQLNEFGERVEENEEDPEETNAEPPIEQIKNGRKYTPIKSYRPSGKLVYSEDLLNKIEDRLNR